MRYSRQRKRETREGAATLNDALLDACRRGAETLLEHADVFVRPNFFRTPAVRSSGVY
jgi:hypothetical protein